MARFRSSMHPVNRIKHVVDLPLNLIAGTQSDSNIIAATDTPVIANTAQVETGSKVNGIYLRVDVASRETDLAVIPNIYMIVWKNPNGAIKASEFPVANAVGSGITKKLVIHQEMSMLNNVNGGNPRTLFNGVIVIPKGMRRFGPEDELTLSLLSPFLDATTCSQVHYKEFR